MPLHPAVLGVGRRLSRWWHDEVTLRSGRFGPYIQLGEAVNGEKPKRSGLPKGLALDDVDLAHALGLLSLPREIGKHPDDGEPILAGIGRFGPYVQHGKTYANVEAGDDVLTIGANRAITLIAEKKEKGPSGRRFGADPGRPLGDHPDKGGTIVVKNGRYGPYVSHDGINATLPSDITPETVTLEQAIGLIDARAASGGGKKKPKRAAAAKGASKKAANGASKGAAKAAKAQDAATADAEPKKAAKKAARPARKAKAPEGKEAPEGKSDEAKTSIAKPAGKVGKPAGKAGASKAKSGDGKPASKTGT
jgi:DNA topoisomerase-1